MLTGMYPKRFFSSYQMILTALCLLHFGCQQNPQDAAQTTASKMPLEVISNGTTINYQVCGSGDITLLFVHGWCINQDYWSYQKDGFCDQYKIVTMDLPGHGQSGKNRDDWSIHQFGKDVVSVIDQLQLENVILIGHSMGGDIIMEAALSSNKVIALVGVDNFKEVGMDFNQELTEEIAGFLDVLKYNFSEVARAYAEGALFHPTTDSLVVKKVIGDILDTDSTIAVATLKELFDYTPKESEKLQALDQPLFLINSSNTPTDTAALSATGVTYDVLEIAATGHYPMIEKPGEFNQLLKRVLEQVEQSY